MCRLYANQSHRSGTSHCKAVYAGQGPHQSRTGPRAFSFLHRRRLEVNAVTLQQSPVQQASNSSLDVRQVPGLRQQAGNNNPDSSGSLSNFRPVLPVSQQASTVEVHLEVQYGCQFGQHVSVVGSPQGWHVPAAAIMTWSEGDVWKAVLPVPAGTDIEYKYIVQWEDGRVARWQDGPNNSLSVQHPGVLMHVHDTWSQQDRSVREVGLRLTHNQQQRQSGGHSSSAASATAAATPTPVAAAVASVPVADLSTPSAEPLAAPPAAQVTFAAAAAAAPPSSGNGASHTQPEQQQVGVRDAAAAVLPLQSSWGAVLPQLPQHTLVFDHFGHFATAAAEEDDELHYEDEEEDQHWPAEMLQKAATAAAAASAPLPGNLAPAATAATAAHQGETAGLAQSTVRASDASTDAKVSTGADSSASSSSKQQPAAGHLAELLPLLRTELEAALAELAKHPEAPHEHGNLLTEGHAVLAALQQQQHTATAAATSSGNARPQATSGRSSPSSSKERGSPGRSPNATLVSGDEIAAALLSDDCEEACFCMVDAICSCSDWDLSCSCDSDPDTVCELSDGEEDAQAHSQHAQHSAAAAHKHAAAHQHAAAHRMQHVPVQQEGEAPASDPAADLADAYSQPAPASALSLAELARAAAIAARHDPYSLAARAAAFSDVQTALQKSTSLLSALSDPCHPLMLEADRKLATASRQLHGGKVLH